MYYKDSTLNLRKLVDQGASGVQLVDEISSQIKSTSGLASKYYKSIPDPGEGKPDIAEEIRKRYEAEYKKSSEYLATRDNMLESLKDGDDDVELKSVKGLGSRPTDDEAIDLSPAAEALELEETSEDFSTVTNFIMSFENEPKETYTAYWDNKQWSIGFGTKAKNKNETIDHAEAMSRLNKSINNSKKDVMEIAKKYGYDWNEDQVSALTSFTFNLGRSNLVKLVDEGNRGDEQISEMILQYNKADGKVLPGLTKRRQAESNLFSSVD
jgi:lysozyme